MADPTGDLPLFSRTAVESAAEDEGRNRLAPGTSLSAAVRAWGEVLEDEGKSIHTVKAFTGDLRLLAKFVGGGLSINAIGTHDLKNFLDWMLNHRGVPCSPKSYSRRVTSMKSFFRWLKQSGVLAHDPADEVPQQTVLAPLPTVLNPNEVAAALSAAEAMRQGEEPDARPYTLLALLLETGIKKGECLGIHVNHVDLNSADGPILFVRYGDVRKRYKERKLSLSQAWVDAYHAYSAQYDPKDKIFPWSPRRLEYLLEDIGQAAGLEKHLSFDMCRWTAALSDYQKGVDKNKIRQKMGISKIQWREVGKKLARLAAKQDKETFGHRAAV
jgi:site-specific recombinase XerD